EGIVICKSASGYAPIKGAVVRIKCLEVDNEGYETVSVSCQTMPVQLMPRAISSRLCILTTSWSRIHGKIARLAFLEQSPQEECRVPSNVNRGIDGYKLSSRRILQDKHLKLYPVGPFFYTPEHKPMVNRAPAGGY
ncbi:unnamed protein product, partial [Linum tenue]